MPSSPRAKEDFLEKVMCGLDLPGEIEISQVEFRASLSRVLSTLNSRGVANHDFQETAVVPRG